MQTNYAINITLNDYVTIETTDVLSTAESLKTDYPRVGRIVGIDGNVLCAISAAFKTASGIASSSAGIIAKNIYTLTKVELAALIVKNDKTEEAFGRAAYELARDVFTSGGINSKAQALADASGRSLDSCAKLIAAKLSRKNEELVLHLNVLKKKGIKPASTAEVFDRIISRDGATLLALPTAYGKTSKIINPVLAHEMAKGSKVLVISHRRSINKNTANIPGIVSYDECDSPEILKNAMGLKIVVNSLASQKYREFVEAADVVVIDEATQVISHVLGGIVKNREAVWNTLKSVVKSAKKLVMADADINANCLELSDRPTKLFKIEQDHCDITVNTADSQTVRGLIVKAAAEGKRVLVACDCAKEVKALGKYIAKKTARTVLVITAENAKFADQADFIANPNSKKYGIVIFSPVITSALSITSGHFNANFGLFGGQVVPSDAIQMLRRDRTAKSFTVGLKNPDYKKAELVEVAFRREAVAMEELLRGFTISADVKAQVRAAIAVDSAPTVFEALRYSHCKSEAWLKDSIQNTLPAVLIRQGFNVKVIEADDEIAKQGFVAYAQGRKAVKKETVSKLLTAKPINNAIVQSIIDAGPRDDDEYMSVVRTRAQEVMGRKNLTPDDAKLWGEGEGEAKIRLFKKLYSASHINQDDALVVFALILPAITKMSLTRGWRAADSANLFDSINAIRSKAISMGINMPRPSTVKAKQAAVTNILKCFGIRTKKIDGGNFGDYYIIDNDSIEQMVSYIKVGEPLSRNMKKGQEGPPHPRFKQKNN